MKSRIHGRFAAAGAWVLIVVALGTLGGCRSDRDFNYHPAAAPWYLQEGLRLPAAQSPRLPTKTPALEPAANSAAAGVRPASAAMSVQSTAPPGAQAEPETLPPPSGSGVEEIPPGVQLSAITLEQAIEECLANNPEIQGSVWDISQAQAGLRTASLIPNPNLLFLSSLNPFPGQVWSPTRQGGPPQMDLQSTWPIDWYLYGKRNAAAALAQRGIDVSAAEVADVVRQRVSETVATFFGVLEAKALMRLSSENAQNLERVVNITQSRVAEGGAAQVDADRAVIAHVQAQRDVRQAQLTLRQARAQLQALLGRTVSDPEFDAVGDLQVNHAPRLPVLENLVDIAVTARPDVIAAERRVAETEAAIVVAEQNRFPELSVISGATVQIQEQAVGFPSQPSWNAGVTGPLPLWDRNQGNRWKAQAAWRQAQWSLNSQRITARSEVEQAWYAYLSSFQVVTHDSPSQLEAARKVLTAIERAYGEGGRPLIELLDAQRIFRDTYRLQINAEVSYWQNMHRLNAAVGQQVLP